MTVMTHDFSGVDPKAGRDPRWMVFAKSPTGIALTVGLFTLAAAVRLILGSLELRQGSSSGWFTIATGIAAAAVAVWRYRSGRRQDPDQS